MQYKKEWLASQWAFDPLAKKFFKLGDKTDHEERTDLNLDTKKIIEVHEEPFSGGEKSNVTTIIVPHWNFDLEKSAPQRKMVVRAASQVSNVSFFVWSNQTISASLYCTANSFERMIKFTADRIEETCRNKPDEEIHFCACSTGVVILTRALKLLYDEWKRDIFKQITKGYLVGMAYRFADCFYYGWRTAAIAQVAKRWYEETTGKQFTLAWLRNKFNHMDPGDALEALHTINGNVTWITSFHDMIFPLETQRQVINTIKRRKYNNIKPVIIPRAGHAGIIAIFLLLGGHLFEFRNTRQIVRKGISLTRKLLKKKSSRLAEWEGMMDRVGLDYV